MRSLRYALAMLTAETLQACKELCNAVAQRAAGEYSQETGRIIAESAAKGIGGNTASRLEEAAANTVKGAADAMFKELLRGHAAEPVDTIGERVAQLRDVFDHGLTWLSESCVRHRDAALNRLHIADTIRHLQHLTTTVGGLRAEYGARIRLAVTHQANTGKAQPVVNHTTNIHGQVGAIQYGDNSTASVMQTVNSGNADALKAAIGGLIEALRTAQGISQEQQREAVEAATALQAEAGKEKPNSITMRGLFGALGTVVGAVPAAVKAYEALRPLLPA
jgi:hypothetical protein